MVKRFAEGTQVSVEKSRAEIEHVLSRYGATAFAYAWQRNKASIQFEAKNRRIKFMLPLPDPQDTEFTHRRYGDSTRLHAREPQVAREAWEKACRQSWRALLLIIKAKLEAVEAQIVTFEEEFLAHVVMPDGRTVAEHARPQIALAYENGKMQPLLPDYSNSGAA